MVLLSSIPSSQSQVAQTWTFDNSPYKMNINPGWPGSLPFNGTDVFFLTGNLTAAGGTAAAHCLAETPSHKCTHSIHFGSLWQDPHPGQDPWRTCTGDCFFRNLSVSFALTGHGFFGLGLWTATQGGEMTIRRIVYSKDKNCEITWFSQLFPLGCQTLQDQSSCNDVGHCNWCSSSDGVHQLCFDNSKKPPPTEWSCDSAKLTLV